MNRKARKDKEEDIISETLDFSYLKYKPDFEYKPLIAIKAKDKNPRLILETFTPYYKEIVEFLIAIGEPKSRTKNFQEYELNKYSLYSAASQNLETKTIIEILDNISKNELDKELKNYIEDNTQKYGKSRIILKNKRCFIHCKKPEILKEIKKNIQEVKISSKKMESAFFELMNKIRSTNLNNKEEQDNPYIRLNLLDKTQIDQICNSMEIEDDNNNEKGEGEENVIMYPSGDDYVEICPEDIESIKEACKDNYPLLEEYDFNNDKKNFTLNIKPNFKYPVRSYQEKALSIMCNNERARSGVIVLPCGSGKTLVGILAMCTIKKNL